MHVLAFGVAVLLASAVGASPTGSHHDALLFNLVARGNATTSNPNYLPGGLLNPILFNLTNATSPAPGAILTADLEGITLTLPWWSSLPGALLDLAIGLKAVSLDWVGVSHGGEKGGLLKGQRTLYQRAWMALHVVEQGYMLVQALAGFAHLAQNADRRDYVRYGGPGVYALLFGATCKLWITKVLLSYPSLAAAWVTALCSLAAFLLLSLPPTGEAPLYRLRSPWAVVPTGYGPNATTFDYRPFWIAPGPDPLGIYSNAMLPKYWVNVFFAAVMGLMLLATLFRQLQFHVFKRELQFRQKWVGELAAVSPPFTLPSCPLADAAAVAARPPDVPPHLRRLLLHPHRLH